MKERVGLDFETYSAADLRKVGLHNYATDLTFQPLIAAVALNDGSTYRIDFIKDYKEGRKTLLSLIKGKEIVAHNAAFEQATLRAMGINIPSKDFIDSAVIARACGAGGSLEAAAPQLLGTDKLESGIALIKLFSIPGKYQETQVFDSFDPKIVEDHPAEWEQFMDYCVVDAELSLQLARQYASWLPAREFLYSAITLDMNNVGWHVDMNLVEEMQTNYAVNVHEAVENFQRLHDAQDLNLFSYKQLQEWCAERGVKARSFDEKHVASLLKRLNKRLLATDLSEDKRDNYEAVVDLLETKQVIGGSSLKKLATIKATTGSDGKLRDQYLHIGAGATYRTTGRGVQMQNLKRLGGTPDDVNRIYTAPRSEWNNDRMSRNLRQVFTASQLPGKLIVGDFASVESRGLAWQAGEDWKLDAYRQGKDMYKVQASVIFGTEYDSITYEQRRAGKVGELSCGYGAGPGAVQAFADGMGIPMSDGEATKLVSDWRRANEGIVDYWARLDEAMHQALMLDEEAQVSIPQGVVSVYPIAAPGSLQRQTGNALLQSLAVSVHLRNRKVPTLTRFLHGVTLKGRNLNFWKPSERKTGVLWLDRFTDPKTGQTRLHSIYGGKLAGWLTQSLCREVFFEVLAKVDARFKDVPNVEVIGQFHDEIVLDWVPPTTNDGMELDMAMGILTKLMSDAPYKGFPLAADVNASYRYIK